jgi:hypothetical protein
MNDDDLPVRNLVLVPAVITLGVTLLRLVGELQGWNPRFFSRAAGGGGALVGIAWLVFVFGVYFGWKLGMLGHRPRNAWLAAGLALLGMAVLVAVGVLLSLFKVPVLGQLAVFAVMAWVAVFITMRGWPSLGKVLLAYAFAARIPVAVVMLVAMLGNWGTHYDVAPPPDPSGPAAPDFAAMNVWVKWFLIGFVPQFTGWIAYTVVLGTLFALLGLALARRRSPQPAAAA